MIGNTYLLPRFQQSGIQQGQQLHLWYMKNRTLHLGGSGIYVLLSQLDMKLRL